MSKYYKAEDVIRKYAEMIADEAYWEHGVGNGKPDEEDLDIAREYYSDLPTIDIVHCKDCKHNPKRTKDLAYGRCVCCCEDDWYGYVPDDDFFCGHGERMEE